MVINKEWLMIIDMTLGGSLFAIGGTCCKAVRRYVLPLVLASTFVLLNAPLLPTIAFFIGLSFALHLGYGQRTPYWLKFLVGISFVAPTLFFGFSVWQVITPLVFITLFWLSNNQKTSKYFTWKIVEFLTGTLIACTVCDIITRL